MRVRSARARQGAFGCAAASLTCLVVLLAVSILAAAVTWLSPGGGRAIASFLRSQPGALRWDGHHRLNILLLGTAGDAGRSQTSSLVVASLDPQMRSLALLSVPPSLWVTIPGYGQGTISQAYADGGPQLALLCAESVTHAVIPYYAVTGPNGLAHLVNAVTGVTLPGDARRAGHRLSGMQAVRFADAVNPEPGGDVGRMHRQQQLLLALKAQVLAPANLYQIPALLSAVGGEVETNFPYDQIPMAARDLSDVPRTAIRTADLDYTDGAVTNYTASGTDVLLPDWYRIRTLAQSIMPDPGLSGAGPVEVLNGAGVPGQAASLGNWLRQTAIPVRGASSATSFNYRRTEVILAPHAAASARYVARSIGTLLHAPMVTAHVPGGHALVAVIIGRDFQDPTQQ